jgi:hypothetical protein
MQDSPTQNYATLNPLYTNGDTGPGTLSDGNLGYTAYTAPGYKVCPGTQSLKDGAYYWEYTAGNVNNSYPGQVGILRGTNPALTTRIGWDTNNNVFGFSLQYNGQVTGDAFGEGTSTEEILTFLPTGYVHSKPRTYLLHRLPMAGITSRRLLDRVMLISTNSGSMALL